MYDKLSFVEAVIWCAQQNVPVAIHNHNYVVGEAVQTAQDGTLGGCYEIRSMETGNALVDDDTITCRRLPLVQRILGDALGQDLYTGWYVC